MEATPEQLLDVHAEISKNAVRLVEGITADQWTEPTPCSEWDVRALVNHMAGTSKVLTASARREAPTSEPNDENLGDDPIASFTAAIAGAEAAWRAPEALAGEVNVPFDMPAVAALGVNILDIGPHCWDLATATGQDHRLSAGAVATGAPTWIERGSRGSSDIGASEAARRARARSLSRMLQRIEHPAMRDRVREEFIGHEPASDDTAGHGH